MTEPTQSGLRLDRLLTLGLFAPLRTIAPRRPKQRLRILMYHAICEHLDERSHPYFRTVTTPERFRSHMEFLCRHDYHVMTLGQALQWRPQALEPHRGGPVVVTFDDGFRNFHTTAFPVLKRLHIPATVFLATGCLDGRFVTGEACLHRSEVTELAAQGVEFGSHTVTHPRLVDLDDSAIEQELTQSRHAIERIVAAPVTLFSYPYRFPEEDSAFKLRLETRLRASGYRAGVTTSIGCATFNDNPFFLRRLPVNNNDDIALFKAKLDGDYDWLHGVQFARKRVRQLVRQGHGARGISAREGVGASGKEIE
jgi:peptidoglycan/xylan/chitin deacetylase (PgdA/CDA1 family)